MWTATWDNIVVGGVIALAVAYLAGQFVFAINAARLLEAIRLRKRRASSVLPLARRRSRAAGRKPSFVRARYLRRENPPRHLDSER